MPDATATPPGTSPATMVTAKQDAAAATPPNRVNFATNVQESLSVEAASDDDNNDDDAPPELYKSNRLKGYITLILAGIINYSAASKSQKTRNNSAFPATDSQRAYAEAAALTSCLLTGIVFIAHLDRWSPLKNVWQKAFGDGSIIELLVIIFLVIWWTVATAIGTSVGGIAGDGKGQYNLYYSTWCCCWTSYWTLERWLVAYGWASFKAFISSWPFRAPGWIAISIFTFLSFMWYLDLYSNHEGATKASPLLQQHYAEIGDAQWDWLLVVGSMTLIPSFMFIIVELFRETSTEGGGNNSDHSTSTSEPKRFSVSAAALNSAMGSPLRDSPLRSSRQQIPLRQDPLPDKGHSTGGKGPLENILEGFCLVLLVFAWIPTVIVATSPGGAASLVGNAYFFTWVNTVFVMETFIWFVHDLRKGVHSALQVKEREYQKRQQEVLQKSRALEAKRMAAGSWQNDAVDDIELDEVLPTTVMKEALAPPLVTHPVYDLARQPEDDEPTSPNMESNDETFRRNNVRLRGTDLEDDLDAILPDNDRSPHGSTLFFEANMELSPSAKEEEIRLENPL